MNKSISKTLIALLVAAGVSSVAMAQSAAPTVAGDNGTHIVPNGQVQAATSPATQQRVPRPGDRNCIQSTGSLIPAKPGTCLPVPGRSYSHQDIQNTGSPTLGPALRELDPSITVSGR